MTIKLGRGEDLYESLKLRTIADAPPASSSSTTGSGVVQNKIYVWHATGAPLEIFEPTETGLGDALTAAATGDAVWIPSLEIILLAAIAIPSGVAVQGLNQHNSILRFTTPNGAMIVMADRAILSNLTVWCNDSANQVTAIDARCALGLVDAVRVRVGDDAANIKIYAGHVE